MKKTLLWVCLVTSSYAQHPQSIQSIDLKKINPEASQITREKLKAYVTDIDGSMDLTLLTQKEIKEMEVILEKGTALFISHNQKTYEFILSELLEYTLCEELIVINHSSLNVSQKGGKKKNALENIAKKFHELKGNKNKIEEAKKLLNASIQLEFAMTDQFNFSTVMAVLNNVICVH